MRHAMPLNDAGHPRPVREIRRTVVTHQRRPTQQRRAQHQGTRHPTHIGRPAIDVADADIEMHRRIMRDFQRKTAMRVHRSLRFAGGARGVDHQERIIGRHPQGRDAVLRRVGKGLPGQPALRDRHPARRFPEHGFDGGELCECLLNGRHCIDIAATAEEAGGGNQRPRAAAFQTGNHRIDAKAAEQRHHNRADIGQSEQRNRRLNAVFTQQPHPVAALYTLRAEPCGETAHSGGEFAEAEAAAGAILLLGHQTRHIGGPGILRPGEHGIDPVQFPVGEPQREFPPARQIDIGGGVLGPVDAEEIDRHHPIRRRVAQREFMQRVVIRQPQRARQGEHMRVLEMLRRGVPCCVCRSGHPSPPPPACADVVSRSLFDRNLQSRISNIRLNV